MNKKYKKKSEHEPKWTRKGERMGIPRKREKKTAENIPCERQIKDKTKQISIQNNQKTRQLTNRTRLSSRHGFRMQMKPLPRGLSPPYLANTRSGGDATREKRCGRNFSFSGLGCMSPESCSKVLSAAKLQFNGN